MEITYTRQGDYYLPNLTLPEQPLVELGMYAQLRRKFLENQHKILYYNLLTKCKLVEHLAEIEQQAFDMEERIAAAVLSSCLLRGCFLEKSALLFYTCC